MSVRVIFNADDLGLVPSVNRGIAEAIEHGVVRSASLMVNMPGTPDAVARLAVLRQRGRACSVGLHFNIVAGRPLTAARSLAHGGEFVSVARLAARAFAGRIRPSDVRDELDAQLARASMLLAPLEMHISHIDSHRHAHCLPVVSDVVVHAARRHGVSHVRRPIEDGATSLGRVRAVWASKLLRVVSPNSNGAGGVGFAGIALMASPRVEHDLDILLSTLPRGVTEIMLHPGYDSPELARVDRYRAPRERELRALTSPQLPERIARLGLELTDFASTAPTA